MLRWFAKLCINAVAIYLAAEWVDGIALVGSTFEILMVAFVFGVVNTLIKPIITIFTLPAVIFTLGIFLLFINGLMLYITDYFTEALFIADFSSAFWGALIVSLVSWLLSGIVLEKKEED